jgi:hypothetical protein
LFFADGTSSFVNGSNDVVDCLDGYKILGGDNEKLLFDFDRHPGVMLNARLESTDRFLPNIQSAQD